MVEARARYREVFGLGEFRAIFAAHLISSLGDVIAAVSLVVLVYERTGSSALSAAVMGVTFVPYAIGGALLGGAADRFRSRTVLVACNLASAALVAVMAAPGVPVPALLGLLFVVSLIAPVFGGVRAATLPDLLPAGAPYLLGRALIRMVSQSAQIVSYGIGGLLLAVTSPRSALAFDAGSFVVSAVVLRVATRDRPARIQPPAGGPAEPGAIDGAPAAPLARSSLARDSLAGTRAVLAHPTLRRVLVLSWLIPACAVAPEALAAPYVTHIGLPTRTAGYLLTGLPIGNVVADVVAARLVRASGQRRLVIPGTMLVFVPFAMFAAQPDLPVAIALLIVSGFGFVQSPGLDALLIETAPSDLRGRALMASTAGLMSIQGLAFVFWGVLGQFASPRLAIPFAGLCGLVILAVFRPR